MPDRSTSTIVSVSHRALHAFVVALLCARGFRDEHAVTIAESLSWADLRGVSTHGVAFLPIYFKMIEEGVLDPKAEPVIVGEDSARFTVEARRAAGSVAMMIATREALRRAETAGVCIAHVRDATHAGAIGRYVHCAAECGFAALALVAGPPFVAYHGTRVPSVSTSPIAIAVPGAGAEPVLLDMATSRVAFSRLRQLREIGKPIPPDWALAEDGSTTTDPARAAIPLPIGGPKGSGLALMIELMTSVLLASPILTDHLLPQGARRHAQNAMLVLLKVDAYRETDSYRGDVAALARALRDLPRAEGGDEILLPGERGARTRTERLRSGIPISPTVLTQLQALASKYGVKFPEAMV